MSEDDEQDIVERLLDSRAIFGAPTALETEAAQTIAALRAERDIAARNRDAARDNFLTMQQSAAILLNRAEAAEAEVKELEAVVRSLQQALKRSSEAGMRIIDQRTTAIRERDEARKALEPMARAFAYWEHYPDETYVAVTILVSDLRRARAASSNREGGEE